MPKPKRKREANALALLHRGDAAWDDAESSILLRNPLGYTRTTELLADLHHLAKERGDVEEFHRRVADIRLRHERKKGFIQRLAEMGVG